MKNELIDLLDDAMSDWDDVISECQENGELPPDSFVEHIADHLLANGATIQRWIPASEKPKEAGEYNVIIKGASVSTTLFYSIKLNAWYEFSDDDFEQPYEITHWMPLPSADGLG